jgi:aldose 1-epimerase
MPTKIIETENLRLEVCPEAGASIVSFEMAMDDEWVPIMRPTPPDALADLRTDDMACFVLAPYSNRIRDARFRFKGKEFQLRSNFPDGTAIHGDVWKRPWKLAGEGAEFLEFTFDLADFSDGNFPFPFQVRLHYQLDENTLDSTIELTNSGNEPMPAGFGFHPYFRRTLIDSQEDVQLKVRVGGVYPGETQLPTGSPVLPAPHQNFSGLRPIGEPDLDHCFSGWDGSTTVFWPGSGVELRFECTDVFSHLVIYTPRGEPFFAVEPVSHCNDAFNLWEEGHKGTGMRVLEPGEFLRGHFSIRSMAKN